MQLLTDFQNVNVPQVSMLHNQTILAKSTLAAYFLLNVIETILTSEWRIGVTAVSDRSGGNTKADCL